MKTDRFVAPRKTSYPAYGPKTTIWRLAVPLKRVNPSVWSSADRLRTKKIHFPLFILFHTYPERSLNGTMFNGTSRQLTFARPSGQVPYIHARAYNRRSLAHIRARTYSNESEICLLVVLSNEECCVFNLSGLPRRTDVLGPASLAIGRRSKITAI